MMVPVLTTAQESRLTRIAKEDPDAKVVGFEGGVILRRGDGRYQRLRNTGRVTPIRLVGGEWRWRP